MSIKTLKARLAERLSRTFFEDSHMTRAGISSGKNIYLPHPQTNEIWKVFPSGKSIVLKEEPYTNSKSPERIFLGVDDKAYSYIQEKNTNTILKISPEGQIITLLSPETVIQKVIWFHYAEWCIIRNQVLVLYISKTKTRITIGEALGMTML